MNRVTILAATLVFAAIGFALVFVLAIHPVGNASNAYNNTIPVIIGFVTMITTAIPALLALLKAEQNGKKLENVVEPPKGGDTNG